MTVERARELLFRPPMIATVLRWLMHLGVPLRDRLDVAQEVMLAAHRGLSNYDPERARPERWLNGITVYVAAHYRDRARHWRELLMAETPDQASDAPDAASLLAAEQEREEVLTLIAALPRELRAVLVALLDGLSMQEIAEKEGVPLSTAYKRRARAFRAALDLVKGRPMKAWRPPASRRKRGDR